jgi:hypothetical protein
VKFHDDTLLSAITASTMPGNSSANVFFGAMIARSANQVAASYSFVSTAIAAFVCPILAPLSVVTSALVVAVFAASKVSPTVKLYYITIGMFDLVEAASRHIVNYWMVVGLPVMNVVVFTSNSAVGGQVLFYSTEALYCCTNAIYLLLAGQRFAVVFFPLRMKHFFTLKASCMAVGVAILASAAASITWAVVSLWSVIPMSNNPASTQITQSINQPIMHSFIHSFSVFNSHASECGRDNTLHSVQKSRY